MPLLNQLYYLCLFVFKLESVLVRLLLLLLSHMGPPLVTEELEVIQFSISYGCSPVDFTVNYHCAICECVKTEATYSRAQEKRDWNLIP